jgi:hypothetical protein
MSRVIVWFVFLAAGFARWAMADFSTAGAHDLSYTAVVSGAALFTHWGACLIIGGKNE